MACGLLALGLLATACSEDADDGTDAGSTDTTAAAPDVLGAPNEATGEPVTIGLITEGGSEAIGSQSELTETGAQIAVDYANEYLGGIGGRPIELFVCGNQATPAGGQDCANQMVERGVVAVTLPFTGYGAAEAPIITGAGIPYVTLTGNSAEELTAPNAFAITGGFPGTLGAFAKHAQAEGVSKFVMITIDVQSATQAAQALGGIVFGNAGVDYEVVAAAPGTPDLSPQLQSAVDSGADAIGVTGDVTFCTSFLQAYKTLALDVTKYLIATCIDPTILESLGDVVAGSHLSTITTNAGADADIYAAIIDRYAPDDDIDPDPLISSGVSAGVSAVLDFVRAMSGISGDITAATALAQMQAATEVPLFLGDGVTFTCDGTAIPLLVNICSADFQIGTLTAEGTLEGLEPIDASDLFAT